jgi:hypothetical protein
MPTSRLWVLDVFVMLMPLEAACQAGANQPDFDLSAFRVYHNDQPLTRRPMQECEPRLHPRVIGIGHRDRKRVSKRRAGLFE